VALLLKQPFNYEARPLHLQHTLENSFNYFSTTLRSE